MTAKEKAKELVEGFYKWVATLDGTENVEFYKAKRCALICVDEILNAPQIGSGWLHKYEPYWTQVKQEIKKL